MASKKSVTVSILDQSLTITTDADPERVEKICDFVTKNLKQVMSKSKTLSPHKAAIVAALNIAEKYFEAVDRKNEFKADVSARSKKILNLLESSEQSS
jgi:cell division protein ZapA (FtsZ GTPase activity inhibitor)